MNDTVDTNDSVSKCPVDLETRSLWGLWGNGNDNNTVEPSLSTIVSGETDKALQQQRDTAATAPASLEEAAKHAQTPHPGQRLALSTHRLESTIPRSSNSNRSTPGHQILANDSSSSNNKNKNKNDDTWVYPSEQQVFNAMKRKGWKDIEEESIPSFLQIHNSVNERSWKEVRKWEERSGTNGDDLELSRFEGRPTDLTPKAWLLSSVLGICDKPFDRHDWYVVRNGSSDEQRYVLDFYMKDSSDDDSSSSSKLLPRVEIDVRPALDNPRAFLQRGQGLLREVFPGIARELDDLRKHF